MPRENKKKQQKKNVYSVILIPLNAKKSVTKSPRLKSSSSINFAVVVKNQIHYAVVY